MLSSWGKDIKKAASLYFDSDSEIDIVQSPEGLIFDEKVPMMLVLPIRFANLKVADVGNVSTKL
jgi:hypothetical protein